MDPWRAFDGISRYREKSGYMKNITMKVAPQVFTLVLYDKGKRFLF